MALTPLIKRLLKPITLWLATLVVVAAVLLFFEADLLWKVQQHNVFLDTTMFFQQMMAMPGGMLEWLATYFSQHFYYPWVGVIILCGWWLLLMWLTKRAFNIPDRWTVLTLVPVAILIVANMCLGYWIYVIKLPGYFYVATIGTTALAALLWAYRILNEKLEVQQVNTAAQRILNLRTPGDILGDQVVRVLDPTDFYEVLSDGRAIHEKREYLAEYGKYVDKTIVYDREYRLILGILRDVTEEETQRERKETIRRQTVEIADKVVDKQMRIVQEIASLLGETAAETKIALTKLKESISHE